MGKLLLTIKLLGTILAFPFRGGFILVNSKHKNGLIRSDKTDNTAVYMGLMEAVIVFTRKIGNTELLNGFLNTLITFSNKYDEDRKRNP